MKTTPTTQPTATIRTPDGKALSARQYLSRTHRVQVLDRAKPCEHGHFDCAAWESGPCENEIAAQLGDIE